MPIEVSRQRRSASKRHRLADFVDGDSVPQRQDHFVAQAHFRGEQGIKFTLRPTFGKERRAKDHDAVTGRTETGLDILAQAVADLKPEFVEPDARPAADQLARQRSNERLLVFAGIADKGVVFHGAGGAEKAACLSLLGVSRGEVPPFPAPHRPKPADIITVTDGYLRRGSTFAEPGAKVRAWPRLSMSAAPSRATKAPSCWCGKTGP